ncbi:MAG: CRISPR-associated helicase/endonuclease Cas3 [Pseudomonadota bacterium]|nr:CRISPR-associated helicase/endonuclease Cas3 [Pseudomonadota bacterium]MDP2351322.1 CRISPR-associated helicase/endonuclease Cas3 [Pseudomonadota bacterium]
MEQLLHYWGKADANDAGEPKWHPLVYHCLDVAAVGSVWLASSPALMGAFQAAFARLEADFTLTRGWLPFFLALHDIGKFDIRFQFKAPDALRSCWPAFAPEDADPRDAKGYDHGREGLNWAYQECGDWVGDPDAGPRYQDAWLPWLQAVTGHHGEWSQPGQAALEAEEGVITHDRRARQAFVQSLAELFLSPLGLSLSDPPLALSPGAKHLLAGFCSVCDWVGSNTEISPYARIAPGATLDSYLAARRKDLSEKRWLFRLGLLREVRPYEKVGALLKPGEHPRGVQTRVDELSVEPGLTLIEAPTGSGKTEAALAYAWRLLEAGHADSIVFALPTQATANAMLVRAEAFAGKAYGDASANVVLAHGKRAYNHDFERLVLAGRTTTAQGKEEAGAQCAEWLAQSRKRVFLGQIGICTVDQTLLSVLPVRHKFVRGFGLNKSLLIVDEIHAYDAYMYGLLGEVLRRQRATGGSAILLSATLPSGVRNKLLAAWGAATEKVNDYPAIWCAPSRPGADATQVIDPITVAEAHQPRERQVGIELLRLPDALPDETLLDRIVQAAEAGALVAVILNLVDAAQATARRLREKTDLPVDIFHARYRFLDRREKEADVLKDYGRGAARAGGRILVATQVVEQSLDLDFDWMVTQICPVDLLFQRLGRLHRHEWRKGRAPGFAAPLCTVVTVEGEDYCVLELIYGNAQVLWRTQKLLTENAQIVFPVAYRVWLESVYGEEDWPDEPPAITRNFNDWWGKQCAAVQEAQAMIATPRLRQFDDDPAITIKTRDGEMSLNVLPMREDGRLLDGSNLSTLDERQQTEILDLNLVPVPASWRNFLRDNAITFDENGHFLLPLRAQGVAHVVSLKEGRMLRYTSDYGLERLESPAEQSAGASPTGVGN